MKQETQPPRTEAASRTGTILAVAFMAVMVFLVAGLAVLTLVWLARAMLGR